MAKTSFTLRWWLQQARALLTEPPRFFEGRVSKLHRFVHFWVLVGQSFSRNRCPVRASALAYATLLALIPMLAVVMSVTSSFLKKQGEDQIDQFIVKMVASVTPPDAGSTNGLGRHFHLGAPQGRSANPAESALAGAPALAPEPGGEGSATNPPAGPATAAEDKAATTRKAIARNIHQFIQNTRSGALGVTGSVLLIFAAISMLSRIETTFNDIWGVAQGRSWFMRIVLYWGVITLVPILLVAALGLATGSHMEATKELLGRLPVLGNFLLALSFQLVPLLLLCLTFGLFYLLIPNARVNWKAALVGGFVGGLLFHLNNLVSVLYVSRVVSNSKIYGSLGLVPVFMIGLYCSWLILLFGAQVAYAFQNRAAYGEERQVEAVNQRGREFVALRLMTCVGQRFERGEPPPGILELSEQLSVPTRLIGQVMQTLGAARLVVETSGTQSGFLPARPLQSITCHDILLALRATQGQELATRDEPTRAEVYGEFQRIQEAERQAAASVTLLAMVNRSQARTDLLKIGN